MSSPDDKLVSGDFYLGRGFAIFQAAGTGMPMYYAEIDIEGLPKTALRMRINDTIRDAQDLIERALDK